MVEKYFMGDYINVDRNQPNDKDAQLKNLAYGLKSRLIN